MFPWEDRVLQRQRNKKLAGAPRLVDKQHRMVCYFFEKLFPVMMIDPNVNLSQNFGFESFMGNWNRTQDNCVLIVDVCISFLSVLSRKLTSVVYLIGNPVKMYVICTFFFCVAQGTAQFSRPVDSNEEIEGCNIIDRNQNGREGSREEIIQCLE